MTFDSQQQP